MDKADRQHKRWIRHLPVLLALLALLGAVGWKLLGPSPLTDSDQPNQTSDNRLKPDPPHPIDAGPNDGRTVENPDLGRLTIVVETEDGVPIQGATASINAVRRKLPADEVPIPLYALGGVFMRGGLVKSSGDSRADGTIDLLVDHSKVETDGWCLLLNVKADGYIEPEKFRGVRPPLAGESRETRFRLQKGRIIRGRLEGVDPADLADKEKRIGFNITISNGLERPDPSRWYTLPDLSPDGTFESKPVPTNLTLWIQVLAEEAGYKDNPPYLSRPLIPVPDDGSEIVIKMEKIPPDPDVGLVRFTLVNSDGTPFDVEGKYQATMYGGPKPGPGGVGYETEWAAARIPDETQKPKKVRQGWYRLVVFPTHGQNYYADQEFGVNGGEEQELRVTMRPGAVVRLRLREEATGALVEPRRPDSVLLRWPDDGLEEWSNEWSTGWRYMASNATDDGRLVLTGLRPGPLTIRQGRSKLDVELVAGREYEFDFWIK